MIACILLLSGCQSSKSAPSSSSGSSSGTATSGAVTIYPAAASVPVNGQAQFSAFTATQPTATFSWSVSGGGTINSSTGAYTAPSSPATVTVTATSSAGSGLTGTATVNVTAAQGVLVSPSLIALPAGATETFSATMNGSAVTATWQVNGTPGGDGLHGTIDSNGNYLAPLTPPPNGTTTITAITGTGSSTASGTATVAIVFSNASFNGPYAFSYHGNNSAGFAAVAGSFTAQGTLGSSGQIFGGVQDALTAGSSSATNSQFTGTFSINPDGSGSATLASNVTWEFALLPNPVGGPARQAQLIRFDASATGSGTIEAQNQAQLSAVSFAGNYAFGLSGVDGQGAGLVIAGRFFADGAGTIPPGSGIEDINDNGVSTFSNGTSTTPTSPTNADTTLQGSFQMDATVPNNGRGTLTFQSTRVLTNTPLFSGQTTLEFAFYIVDTTHLKIVETDNKAALAGDFYSAANAPSDGAFDSEGAFPNGKYAFTVMGTGANGAYAAGGILAVTGGSTGTSGQVGGVLDVNNGIADIRLDSTITSSTYSIDPNFGRITLPITVNLATANFIGYTAAYNAPTGPVLFVVLIETDSQAIASGIAFPQASSVAPPQGNYALNLAGASGPKNGAVKQDILGEISTLGTTSFSGDLFINNLALAKLSPHVALTNNTSLVSPAANGRGTATIATSVASLSLAYYVIDANSALLLEADGARIATGVMAKQY